LKIPSALTLAVAKPMRKVMMGIRRHIVELKNRSTDSMGSAFVDWKRRFQQKSANGGI
jgi:hypothetical protein